MKIEILTNGVWENQPNAMQPVNWSYRLNEEFDTGFFTIFYSPRKTPYPMFTKMRIIEGGETTYWYCSSQVKKPNQFDELYHHTVTFVEPTIILQYVTMSGETFTQPTTGAKKTMADYFNRLLAITPLRVEGEEQRFNLVADERLNIEAREFTTLNNNLLEAFIDGARYIHAFPRMRNYTDIEFDYFGDLTNVIENQNYILQNKGTDPNKYCSDIEVQAENMVSQKTIIYPAPNMGVTVRGSSIDLTSDNAYIQLPMPIERLVNVKMWGFRIAGTGSWVRTFTQEDPFYLYKEDDASLQFIIEKEIWDSLPTNTRAATPTQISKCERMYYSRYSDKIENVAQLIGGFLIWFGVKTPTWRGAVCRWAYDRGYNIPTFSDESGGTIDYDKLLFSIEYIPSITTRTRQTTIEKRETEATLIDNQDQNIVDFAALGKNLVGKSARIGNEFVKETNIYNSLKALPKVGGVRVINGQNYILETQDIEWWYEYTKATNTYTKDFSRISSYIGLNQQRRAFELSTAIVRDRKLYRQEYVVFDTVSPLVTPISSVTPLGMARIIRSIFGYANASWDKNDLCQNSVVSMKDKNGAEIIKLLLPTFCNATGKSLQFDFALYNNLSAGKMNVEGDGSFEKDSSLDILYTDNGEVEKMEVKLAVSTASINYDANKLPKIYTFSSSEAIDLPLIVKKDTAERLLFSQQLHFVDNSGKIAIGNGFLEENALITDRSTLPIVEVYGFTSQVNRLNPSLVNGVQIAGVYSHTKHNDSFSIEIQGNGNYEAIGLVANGKLLYALNEKVSGNFSKTVYLYFSKER